MKRFCCTSFRGVKKVPKILGSCQGHFETIELNRRKKFLSENYVLGNIKNDQECDTMQHQNTTVRHTQVE